MAEPRFAYLDASAFVKLVKDEPESAALEAALGAWPRLASSTLLEVEGLRAARRTNPVAYDTAMTVLGGMELLEIDADVVVVATNHSAFSRPEALRAIAERATADCLVVDPWNALGTGQVFAYVSEVVALRA